MNVLKITMPSQGDMSLTSQEGGTITLKPEWYFGGRCFGPTIQVVGDDDKVKGAYRLVLSQDGDLKTLKADSETAQ